MSYIESERQRAIAGREKMFRDPGQGIFFDQERDFVLNDPTLNLWAGIRDDAIAYFDHHKISWWKGGSTNTPTGHLLSSQIACVNHLFPARQRVDVATAILQGLDSEIVTADRIDDGYVAFEFIGSKRHLMERGFTRGANCTSLDAAMVGITGDGQRRLFLIEWKYVETYQVEDKYIDQRAVIYDQHIMKSDGPIEIDDPAKLYYEPFYQLMRQTLLGWLMVQGKELGCTSYRHVHIAPAENIELLNRVTSPSLPGKSVYEAWRSVLRGPELFISKTPKELLSPVASLSDTKSAIGYLARRYWATAAA